jgi:hypothetical protein
VWVFDEAGKPYLDAMAGLCHRSAASAVAARRLWPYIPIRNEVA